MLDSVDKYFDEDINQRMLTEIEEQYSQDEIEKIVKDKFLDQKSKEVFRIVTLFMVPEQQF